jgi:hypothetical protein
MTCIFASSAAIHNTTSQALSVHINKLDKPNDTGCEKKGNETRKKKEKTN